MIRKILLVACTLVAVVSSTHAQDVEPRTYTNAPIGLNVIATGFAYTHGGISFEPSSPIQNPDLNTYSTVLAYARVVDLWGKSGKVNLVIPYTWLSGSADYRGARAYREVNGFVDAVVRMSVNLYGAPALRLKEFAAYRQNLIIGASLQASVPRGQYDPSRVVNIGTNRWSLKAEAGVSKVVGRWTLEFATAATLYTDNGNFYGGDKRSQDPVYLIRGHAIYSFRSSIWASLDATYMTGGRTTINGAQRNDLQENWRVGGTLTFPVTRRNSVKLYASSGVSSRTGNNYDLIGAGWQYRWGGGL